MPRREIRKAIEEYAVECSILKVWGSEMLDFVVDETVQIFGGYGFVEEYPAERAYRDSRVNRIFEGTNEINRLIITGWLLKRAMSGQIPLLPAIKKLMDEVLSGPVDERRPGRHIGRGARDGRQRQEGLAVCLRHCFAKVHAGARRSAGDHGCAGRHRHRDLRRGIGAAARAEDDRTPGRVRRRPAVGMARVYLQHALEKVETSARKVIAAVADGDMLRTQLAILQRLLKYEPFNTIALRQQIAQRVIEAGKYVTV